VTDHGIDHSEIAEPLLAEDDIALNQKFEQRYEAILKNDDDGYQSIRLKKLALLELNPVCMICGERIDKFEKAILWEASDRRNALLCGKGECSLKAIHQSVSNYLKPKKASAA
jgi:GR25 family glycosyltransferase involved in LPS biosynthesis